MKTLTLIKDFFIKIGKRIKANFGWKSAVFIGVLIVLVAADLLLKYFEEAYEWKFDVIPGFIEVQYGIHNMGAGFSWLADKSWGQPFLIALTFIMIFVIAGVILALPERFTLLKLSLYIILAGAIGNLVDRLCFGYVRDFVWLLIVNAYCNFADFWIVIGGIMAVLDMLFFNEWAVFPLTKKAKEAQAEHKKKEEEKKLSAATAGPLSTSSDDVDCKGENSKKEGEKLSEGGKKADDSPSQGDESHE